MSSLLLPLPVLAVVLAALDALLVRTAQPWRTPDVRLFFHAYFVWLFFGLVALAPARATLAVLDRRRTATVRDARCWLVLLTWMVAPVATHAILDRHTTLVGFSGLGTLRPWGELALMGLLGWVLWRLLDRTLGRVSGIFPATAATVVALSASLAAARAPDLALADSGPARPNLLLLVWDTTRSDRLQPYGHERETSPGLARLAEESLVFTDALSASTFTFTSHLSMLTGVTPNTHGAHLLDMTYDPARATSIAEVLKAQGYRTGAFVGTDVLAGRTGMRAGFDVYDDAVDPAVCDTWAWRLVHDLQSLAAKLVPALRLNGRPHWIQDFQRPGGEVLENALAFVRRDDPRPWFCFVNLYDAHWPYLPEGPGRELVRPYEGPVDGFLFRSDRWEEGYEIQPEDARHVADLYEAEIHDLDQLVADFLDDLDLELGSTAVLMTSDHGEGLGEHGTWNHDDVREPQVRVPLLLRLPAANPGGRRVEAPASGIDVMPTLLSLAGVAVPDGVEGLDLSNPEIETIAGERERWIDDRDHLDADDHHTVLYEGPWKLVRQGVGERVRYSLFDLEADPTGFEDVHGAHPDVLAALTARLEARAGRDEGVSSGGETGSAAALKALGYTGD
jgi:arylsulfatase A-like enzyme